MMGAERTRGGGVWGGGALFPPAAPLSNDFPGATSAPTGPGRAAYSLHANLITLGQPASLPAVQSKAKQKSRFSFVFSLLWLVFNRPIFFGCTSLHVEIPFHIILRSFLSSVCFRMLLQIVSNLLHRISVWYSSNWYGLALKRSCKSLKVSKHSRPKGRNPSKNLFFGIAQIGGESPLQIDFELTLT